MKVPGSDRPSALQKGERATPTRYGKSGAALPPAVSETSDPDVSVEVSPVARILSRVRETISQEEVDTTRVSRVRDQLARGTYQIDNQALARAFIEKELRWMR